LRGQRCAPKTGALGRAGQRFAEVLGLPFAELDPGDIPGDEEREAITLRDGPESVGTLLVPVGAAARQRVERIVPSLEALLAATRDRHEINAALEASHGEVSARAKQQAALRSVATLVARGTEPAEVYPVAVVELARGLDVQHVTLMGYEADRCVVVAAHREDQAKMSVGECFPLDGQSLTAQIRHTAEPARIDDYSGLAGSIAARLNKLGVRSGVGSPVIVDGRVRGALMVGSTGTEPMPTETEDRVCDFADLIATAIYNSENRAELKASRARIVAAADQARRGFERDLHDRAQQRIVSLGMQLRALEASAPPETREGLSRAAEGLTGVHADLQELSRGIHPAILSRGGLAPAIKTLARRSAAAGVDHRRRRRGRNVRGGFGTHRAQGPGRGGRRPIGDLKPCGAR
jgi:GAF domain-containing protein